MELIDKVMTQAGHLADKAQHGMAEGKEKIEDLQAKRRRGALLHDLGEAVYAQRRSGGPESAVEKALLALDQNDAHHDGEHER
jgi:hypothetical protein